MTAEQALHSFYSSFGIPAYEEHAVPSGDSGAGFPYLTYSVTVGEFGASAALYADLWYRDASWVKPNAKARQISDRLGRGGILLRCDGGAIWLRRGQPFSLGMGDEADDSIRRVHLNITAEFLV